MLVAPDRSVADHALMGIDGWIGRRVPRAERRPLVERTLAQVAGTAIPLGVTAGQLSLAAQQLVVLARALVRRPRILVVDEITERQAGRAPMPA